MLCPKTGNINLRKGGCIAVSLSINKKPIRHKLYINNSQNIHLSKNFEILTYTQSCGVNSKEAPLCNLLRLKASYTVEAAFILPISLMMVIFFLYFFRVMYVQWGVDYTVNKIAREHAAIIDDSTTDDGLIVVGQCMADIASMDRVKSEIVGGIFGMDFTESEFDKNYIDIICNYKLKNPITFFGKKTINMTSVASSRKWVGYDPLEDEDGSEYVFVTKYGTAYHKSLSCPYLKPSVHAASSALVGDERNNSGGKYKSCPMCKGKKNSGVVYITEYGDVYHSTLNCSALKRSIKRIKIDEAGAYHACGKCAS